MTAENMVFLRLFISDVAMFGEAMAYMNKNSHSLDARHNTLSEKFPGKTLVIESVFNKVVGFQACNFIKQRL